MRHTLLAGVVLFAPSLLSVAHAQPSAPPGASPLRPLAMAELPERCRDLARVPASSVIPDPDMAAHVSVANCMADEVMGRLALQPDASSMSALDGAAEPSAQILDDVIAHGGPRWQVIADAAKADLYRGMVVRMRIAMSGRDAPASVEAGLATWLDNASRASRAAADVARTESVSDDPVVRSALASLVVADARPTSAPVSVDAPARLAPHLLDAHLVRRLHRAIAAEQLVIEDRDQLTAAQAKITADTRRLGIDVQRAAALQAAWHRASAAGEPGDAATLARARFEAIGDETAVRASLAQARASYDAAVTQLALDRQHLREVEARGVQHLRSPTALSMDR